MAVEETAKWARPTVAERREKRFTPPVFANKNRWINSRKIYDRNECLREGKRVAINAIAVLVWFTAGMKAGK